MTDENKKTEGWKAWLGARFINPEDRERDAKILMFILGELAAILWLSYDLHRSKDMSTQWVDAFMWFLASISLGGALWTAVDAWKQKGKGTKDPDGGGQ